MSYIDQAQDPRRSATALVGVVAVHVAIGLGLVVGLTVSGILPEEEGWDPFTLTPDPLPKPRPPEPAKQDQQDSFVTVPPTPLKSLNDDPIEVVVDPIDKPRELVVDPGPRIEPVVEPTVRPTFTPRKPRPTNNQARWITNDDYPARALRAEAEGVAGYRLIVSTNGQVSACEVTRSTGNGQLDDATCQFIARRARFEAATDETGAKVVGSYTGTVKWQIPD